MLVARLGPPSSPVQCKRQVRGRSSGLTTRQPNHCPPHHTPAPSRRRFASSSPVRSLGRGPNGRRNRPRRHPLQRGSQPPRDLLHLRAKGNTPATVERGGGEPLRDQASVLEIRARDP